jgi:hypothetical protein
VCIFVWRNQGKLQGFHEFNFISVVVSLVKPPTVRAVRAYKKNVKAIQTMIYERVVECRVTQLSLHRAVEKKIFFLLWSAHF